MQFNSLQFLVFFPIVVLVYLIVPRKMRSIWLLAASYFFYMGWNAKYAVLIAFSTVTTYAAGLMIERAGKAEDETKRVRRKKLFVALSFLINLAILFAFKYFNFALDNLNLILRAAHLSVIDRTFDVLLPVGISFYTFQALGYTIDVYRGEITAEKNLISYALFVSFFPQLVAGPIERSGRLLRQIRGIEQTELWNGERIRDGLLRICWGLFEKLMIADRAAIAVDAVYNQYGAFGGGEIVLATVLFAFQIYCDFDAYSNIAIGAAKVCGFELMENFRQPYFAVSIADFWRRWHISLSTWFRDYLYIPLGGSRVSKVRHYMNLMIVFLVSGAWHGASWHYILWGGLHGAYQIVGKWKDALLKRLARIAAKERGNAGDSATADGLEKSASAGAQKPQGRIYRIVCIIVTFILTDLAWGVFRANSLGDIKGLLMTALRNPHFADWKGMNLSVFGWLILGLSLLVLLVSDLLHAKGVVFCAWLGKRNVCIRVLVYALVIGCLIIYGVYGASYDTSQFIYFQF